VCKGGGGGYGIIGVEGASDRSTPVAKSLYWSIFLDNDILYCFYQSNLSTVWSFHSIRRLSLVTIYGPCLPVPFHTDVFYVLFDKFDESIFCFESAIYPETKFLYLEKFYWSNSLSLKEHFVSRTSIFIQSESAVFERE
jgi:hypothetical protein